ncbi:methyltransferase domain-containing protein [Synechocystis sp. LKSZ1]|uniref:methyltransferase domain-containing protein n=1 Tax=Synechocystis sp. LKSZ1 TaxID=3144951 RepID=UPI00336C08A9
MVLEQSAPPFTSTQLLSRLQIAQERRQRLGQSPIPPLLVTSLSLPVQAPTSQLTTLPPLRLTVGEFLTTPVPPVNELQDRITYITGFLQNAAARAQVRERLAQRFEQFPYNSLKLFQTSLLKAFNLIFRDQREVNANLLAALQEALGLVQRTTEQLQSLRQQTHRDLTHVGNVFQDLIGQINYLSQLQNRNFDLHKWHLYEADTRQQKQGRQLTELTGQVKQLEQQVAGGEMLADQSQYRLDLLQNQVEALSQQLQAQEERYGQEIQLLRQELQRIQNPVSSAGESSLPQALDLDALYLALEDRFRGNPAEIRQRLSIYLPFLAQVPGLGTGEDIILDLGCGRGEWLALVNAQGYQGRGIDLNHQAVKHCQKQGFNVITGEALAYLQTLENSEIAVITSFHVIEHLPFPTLVQLLQEIHRVLRPGGLLILETPNPDNLLVGSRDFYLDPTHRQPLPSLTTQFLVEQAGFSAVQILPLNPSSNRRLSEESDLARRFNQYFYGPMDYAIIASK